MRAYRKSSCHINGSTVSALLRIDTVFAQHWDITVSPVTSSCAGDAGVLPHSAIHGSSSGHSRHIAPIEHAVPDNIKASQIRNR